MKNIITLAIFCLSLLACSSSRFVTHKPSDITFKAPRNCSNTYDAVFSLDEEELYYYKKSFTGEAKEETLCIVLQAIGRAQEREVVSGVLSDYSVHFYNEESNTLFGYTFRPQAMLVIQLSIIPRVEDGDPVAIANTYYFFTDILHFGAVLSSDGALDKDPFAVTAAKMTQGQFEMLIRGYFHEPPPVIDEEED